MKYWLIKSLVDGEIVERTATGQAVDDALFRAAKGYARSAGSWFKAKGAVRRFLMGVQSVVLGLDDLTLTKIHRDIITGEIGRRQ